MYRNKKNSSYLKKKKITRKKKQKVNLKVKLKFAKETAEDVEDQFKVTISMIEGAPS